MAVPRMRTAEKVLDEIKKADPDTEVTLYYIRSLIRAEAVPVVASGRKKLVNVDAVMEALASGYELHTEPQGNGRDQEGGLMMLFPKANKTSMVKLLRSKGFNIPSLYQAEFSSLKYWFGLSWADKTKKFHSAYYSAAAGRPVLLVDSEWVEITMAEAIHFGLVQEK